jgi:hypothetical protein
MPERRNLETTLVKVFRTEILIKSMEILGGYRQKSFHGVMKTSLYYVEFEVLQW